jgi:type II secretory pathway pseudopilin PulG
MLDLKTKEQSGGFSMLELVLVVSIILVLGAVAVPQMMGTFSDFSLRYQASDFSSLLQTARIQAVRKNAPFSVISGSLAVNEPVYFVDKPTTTSYAAGDPIMPLSANFTMHQGTGSGIPNEGNFIAGLNFTVYPGTASPSFNARGLPCLPVSTTSCTQTVGQGYVMFISKNVAAGSTPGITLGGVPYVAIVINPSGRVLQWTADKNGNWLQRN